MTTTADLLATIVAATRRSVELGSHDRPLSALSAGQHREPHGAAFHAALRTSDAPRVIAECKRRSPSRGILRQDYDAAAHAASYEAGGAAAISVLTEPTFFDGALEHLAAVRAAVSIPVLRKDFIVTEYQLVEAAVFGADAVLLIVGALGDTELRARLAEARSLRLATLVEVHDLEEGARAVEAGAEIIGVNSRNLRTLSVDPSVHEAVVHGLPANVTKVAESGIRSASDVTRLSELGYDAFLVGERLIVQPDPGAALRELRER